MKYDDLLKSGHIRAERVSQKEIDRAMERSGRDLVTAREIIQQDLDWCFAIAYDVLLQASRAYMFAQGYRPASSESHKNTLAFMRVALGKQHRDMIDFFDRMRIKRNQALYDLAGTITETEARTLIRKATEYVELIQSLLGKTV